MTRIIEKEILDFLHRNPLGVISTIDKENGAPKAAVVAFAETEDFKIIFQTLNDTRKYSNLKKNPRIAFVTGWQIEKKNQITFQYEGVARELKKDSDEYKKYRSTFEAKKTPCTSEFLNNSKSRLFITTPSWFKYSDYTQKTPRIIEELRDAPR